jgi:deoxyribose-phosphate aldolase
MTPELSLTQSAQLALQCLDLTSLNDADTAEDIKALCHRAQTRFGPVAAVCVWPRFVALARSLLPAEIGVAAVANFPAGALDVPLALADTKAIVESGGNEVDVVLPYRTLMQGQAEAVADFLARVRAACGPLTLKVIIESGELKSPALIAQATQLALAAGANFVKTSTGKTSVSATLDAAAVMLREIARSGSATAGFKASGGIRSVPEAKTYLELAANVLGPQALTSKRFRFGASGLLNDIEAVLGGQASSGSTSSAY